MKDLSQVKACVIDKGQFPFLADLLGRSMDKVWYANPSAETAFPKLRDGSIGRGFETFTYTPDFWKIKNQCDLFVFPDVGFTGLQAELQSQGFSIWGQNGQDILETDRGRFIEKLTELGLEVVPHVVIKGMENLRVHLRDKEDKYIKVSKWRGDWETFHWRNWTSDSGELDQKAYLLGPLKEILTFYVFDSIPTDVEDGIDTHCIDGALPKLVMHAMEWKDKGFLAAMQKLSDVDEGMQTALRGFAATLEGYRQFLSTEARLVDEQTYFIDPTMRAGSPPSQLQCELVGNLAQIIWSGANGELVEPEPTANFAVQCLISCDREPDETVTLEIPKSIRPYVKSSFSLEYEGNILIPPNHLGHMTGWLVACGDTIQEAIDTLKERREELPCGVDCDVMALAHLLEEAQEAKKLGVEITEQTIPEPEVVL